MKNETFSKDFFLLAVAELFWIRFRWHHFPYMDMDNTKLKLNIDSFLLNKCSGMRVRMTFFFSCLLPVWMSAVVAQIIFEGIFVCWIKALEISHSFTFWWSSTTKEHSYPLPPPHSLRVIGSGTLCFSTFLNLNEKIK